MEEIISKEEIEKIKKIKGEVRGIVIKTYGEFILKEEKEKGLEKLENEMAKIGYPIKYKKIKVTSFFPLELQAINLTVIKRLFNYNEKKFQEMGRFESKADTIIIRLFMKYLVSLEMAANSASKMWNTYFTVGDIKTIKLDEEKRYIILRLENFYHTPIICENLKGYFQGLIQMIVKEQTTCEETKCIHKGDDYHEFLLRW